MDLLTIPVLVFCSIHSVTVMTPRRACDPKAPGLIHRNPTFPRDWARSLTCNAMFGTTLEFTMDGLHMAQDSSAVASRGPIMVEPKNHELGQASKTQPVLIHGWHHHVIALVPSCLLDSPELFTTWAHMLASGQQRAPRMSWVNQTGFIIAYELHYGAPEHLNRPRGERFFRDDAEGKTCAMPRSVRLHVIRLLNMVTWHHENITMTSMCGCTLHGTS